MMVVDDQVSIAANGNVGVEGGTSGGQINDPETLNFTTSVNAGSITGFSGNINFDGITQLQLANFTNAGDVASLSFPASSAAGIIVGTTSMGGVTGVDFSTGGALFDLSAAGITSPVPSISVSIPTVSACGGEVAIASFTNQFTAKL